MDTVTLPVVQTPKLAGPAARVSGVDVVVAIPVLNEEAHIEACVRSLMAGDERVGAADVVVIDGGSTDRTREIVVGLAREYPNLRLAANPKKLQSAGVNLAATSARGKRCIMVRCDAHALYPDGYVMRVADALAGHGSASLVVPMDAVGKTCFQRANAAIVDTPLGSGGSTHRGGRKSGYVDHGHHAGFDLAKFLDIGGYDETFSHNEDAEFDHRLRAAGGEIYLDAEIRLSYFPRDNLVALAKQYFNYGKGRERTLAKHRLAPRLRQMIPPATMAASLFGFAIAPVQPFGLILPFGYLGALLLASLVMAVKLKSACGLLTGPASAAMHMSWSAGFFWQMLKNPRG